MFPKRTIQLVPIPSRALNDKSLLPVFSAIDLQALHGDTTRPEFASCDVMRL